MTKKFKETELLWTLTRRDALGLGVTGLLGLAGARSAPAASAANWPGKPIRLIVPSAPSTPGDSVARALSDLLAQRLGQPVVIDNRSGAQGSIGLEALIKSPPDGYTLGLLNIQQTVVPAMRANMPFKLETDVAPVIQLTSEATVLVVRSTLSVNSVKSLLDYAHAHPGKLSYGSSGNGSPSHLGMELLRRQADLQITHIPYRSPAAVITDLSGGQLDLALLNSAAVLQALGGGRVRALAVSPKQRMARLPDVPTLDEAGLPGLDLQGWVGVVAPAGVDAQLLGRLNQELNAVLAMPQARERLQTNGSEPKGGTVQAFAQHIASETRRWGEIVRSAKIKMD